MSEPPERSPATYAGTAGVFLVLGDLAAAQTIVSAPVGFTIADAVFAVGFAGVSLIMGWRCLVAMRSPAVATPPIASSAEGADLVGVSLDAPSD
jgi:hypothetical protein